MENRIGAVLYGFEYGQHSFNSLRGFFQFQHHFSYHGQRAFAADEKTCQVVAGIVSGLSACCNNRAVIEHNFQPLNMVGSHDLVQHTHPIALPRLK